MRLLCSALFRRCLVALDLLVNMLEVGLECLHLREKVEVVFIRI